MTRKKCDHHIIRDSTKYVKLFLVYNCVLQPQVAFCATLILHTGLQRIAQKNHDTPFSLMQAHIQLPSCMLFAMTLLFNYLGQMRPSNMNALSYFPSV